MLTKEQLLNQLQGKTEIVDIEGVGEIEIKSLSFADVEILQGLEAGMGSALVLIRLGLVNPELDEEDLQLLSSSNPKKILAIAEAISELSGMLSEEDFLETTGTDS